MMYPEPPFARDWQREKRYWAGKPPWWRKLFPRRWGKWQGLEHMMRLQLEIMAQDSARKLEASMRAHGMDDEFIATVMGGKRPAGREEEA